MKIKSFIATSMDGYIATKSGDLEWLHQFADPECGDFGYTEFISRIDAILMGRITFEKVCSFEEWPYSKPVHVLSNTLKSIPPQWSSKACIEIGEPQAITEKLIKIGYKNLYIDGGQVIQSFLHNNQLDELTISVIPMLLGEGIPLFKSMDRMIRFQVERSISFRNGLVQTKYVRPIEAKNAAATQAYATNG